MPNERKQALLNVLKAYGQSMSLRELTAELGAQYPNEIFADRSVRRWLQDFVASGEVVVSGQKRSTRYRAAEQPVLHSDTANEALSYVQQPIFKRQPTTYDTSWFEQYIPNKSQYLNPKMLDELRQEGWRDQQQDDAGTYARKIYNRLLIDLSYNSSRLEGNTYSILDTEKLISEGISAQGKLDAERVMILNHKEAIRHLVDNAPRLTIDFERFCTLHYLLSDGLVPTGSSGHVRKEGVRIGGSTYLPMEGSERLTQQLTAIGEKASQINDPIEQSFFLLIHIAYLQAFIDVNKRTSRLSANIPLIKNNLVPLSFNDVDKDDYATAMICVYERLEVAPIAEIYRYSYLRTCQHYDTTIESIGVDEIRVRYRTSRRTLIRDIIEQKLHGDTLRKYTETFASEQIQKKDRMAFLKSVEDDLREINPQRIAGMGISKADLEVWLKTRDS